MIVRRIVPLLLFALPLFGGLKVESPLHRFAVDVARTDAELRYAFWVTDVATGAQLASDALTGAPGEEVSKTIEAGGRTLRVSMREHEGKVTADFTVERDGVVLDSLSSTWLPSKPVRPQPAGGAPLRVGGDVRAPVVVKRVEPVYTTAALKTRISGVVILELVINREGKVTEARVLKPLPFGLDQAAIDAVRQWQFQPGTLRGEPVDVIWNQVLNFTLPQED